MGDTEGEVEFEQWAEATLAMVAAERNAEYLTVIKDAVGPLERHQFHLRQSIAASYALVHEMERELIVVEDRLGYCNRAIRTGEVPRGVDVDAFRAYGEGNKADKALTEKEDNDGHSGNDGRGVRAVSPRPRSRARRG